MATERQRARCLAQLERLGALNVDGESIRREAIAALRGVIGFDRWCLPDADPETLIPLSGLAEHDFGPAVPRWLELEYSSVDHAAKHVVGRWRAVAGSLNAETAGDLARSRRWDEVMRPVGIGDVATAGCRDAHGCWGWIELYRDRSDRAFTDVDLQLLDAAGALLGAALRRGAMVRTGNPVEGPGLPGVIVLGLDLRLVSWTDGARAWIDALPGARMFAAWGILPAVVYPAATLARLGKADQAHALHRTVDGRWLRIEAAVLEGDDAGRIAVSLRAARTSELFDLTCRAYALSRRERDVVAMLVRGYDTRAVAQSLFISAHTVQDHLKSIFEKTGVHSRRELLATLSAAG